MMVEVRHKDFELISVTGGKFNSKHYMRGIVLGKGKMPNSGKVDIKSLSDGETYSLEVEHLRVLND